MRSQTSIPSKKNPAKPLAIDQKQLEQFIGILYVTSLAKMPSTRLYWNSEFYFEKVAQIMTINPFEFKKSVENMSYEQSSGFTMGVTLLSTYESVEPTKNVERFDKKASKYVNVSCPSIVTTYNQFMGGVDLSDGLLSLYWIH